MLTRRRFVQALHHLSRPELNDLRRFFRYVARTEEEEKAFVYIIECFINGEELEEAIFFTLYGLNIDQTEQIRRNFNHAMASLEDFLALRELKDTDNKLLRLLLLLQRFARLGIIDLYKSTFQRACRLLERGNEKRSSFQRQVLQFFSYQSFFNPFYTFVVDSIKGKVSFLKNVMEIDKLNDEQHFLEKLKYTAAAYCNNPLNEGEKSSLLLEEVLRLSREVDSNEQPLLTIYRLVVQIFKEFKGKDYLTLKELILDGYKTLPPDERYTVWAFLNNHTAKAIRTDAKYGKEAIEIFEFGIKEGILIKRGFLEPLYLINLISTFSAVGQINKAKSLWNQSKDKLDENLLPEIEVVCESTIFCNESPPKSYAEYQKAYYDLCDFNQNVHFSDKRFAIIVGNNRIKICYDWLIHGGKILEDRKGKFFDFRRVEVRRFRNLLNNLVKKDKNKVMQTWILSNQKFLYFIDEFLTAYTEPNIRPIKKRLKKELGKTHQVACRQWLEKRIASL